MSAEKNRKLFPFAAKMVDMLREHFPDASVSYAEENGRVVGEQMSIAPETRICYHQNEIKCERTKRARKCVSTEKLEFMVSR